MSGRMVVMVDGSAATQPAVDLAVSLAAARGLPLLGVFVIDAGWPDYIGNDWQSAAGARQGFLDHIRQEQEAQAEAARAQFAAATPGLAGARFEVRPGDPVDTVVALACAAETELLVTSRRVFQVSGRPSLKRLARALADKATRPLLLLA